MEKIYIYPIALTCSIHFLLIIAYIYIMIVLGWFEGKTLCFCICVHLPVSEIWKKTFVLLVPLEILYVSRI